MLWFDVDVAEENIPAVPLDGRPTNNVSRFLGNDFGHVGLAIFSLGRNERAAHPDGTGFTKPRAIKCAASAADSVTTSPG